MLRQNLKKEQVRVSLLPDNRGNGEGGIFAAKKMLIIILLAVIVVPIISAAFLKIQANRSKKILAQRQIEFEQMNVQLALLESEAREKVDLGQRIGFAKSALDSHIAAEQILAILERTAIAEVALVQLAVDGSGTLVLSARGSGFDAVTRQIMAWREDQDIANAQVSGISTAINKLGEIEGIDFNAALTLDAQALKWQP